MSTLPSLTNQNSYVTFSNKNNVKAGSAVSHPEAQEVLAREAGVPFQPLLTADSGNDSFAEWLSLMEVVQMLCPAWPVRDSPMLGTNWRL
jgi:hypothetical protein